MGPANFFSILSRKNNQAGVSEPVMTGVTKGLPSLKAILDAISVFLDGSHCIRIVAVAAEHEHELVQ